MTELKPCPFCGRYLERDYIYFDGVAYMVHGFIHEKSDCMLSNLRVSPNEVEKWNTCAVESVRLRMNLDELAFKDLLENLNLIQYKNLDEDELMDLAVVCARVDNKANDEIYRRLCEEEVKQ